MINHQNFSTAYPVVNKVSFDELGKFSIIPIKDHHRDFGTSLITTNLNNEEWKNRTCENTNQAGINIEIPFICDPADNIGQNGNNNKHNGNNDKHNGNNNQHGQDMSDKVHKKFKKLKEKFDDSIFGNEENGNFQSEELRSNSEDDSGKNGKHNKEDKDDKDNDANKDEDKQLLEQQEYSEDQEENKAKGEPKNNYRNNENNDNNENDDKNLGIAGLSLDIEKKLADADKKIENLKNKINNENTNLLSGQQEENKAKDKNNKVKDNNDESLGITGLDLKIQKIEANAEKRIQKLIDKIENDKDNRRLIDQREESEEKDDDDDSDDSKDNDGETYEGYNFNGGDNDNGKDNDDKNFNFATAGDFGCSKNTQNTIANMEKQDPDLVLALGDLSYHSSADCWFDIMSPLKGKIMITLGHHDTKDGDEKMDQYTKSFKLEKEYYSYDYKQVHFVIMAALSDYEQGSEQYNFVKQDLEKASQNEDINWIIVSTYKPLYTSPSQHEAEIDLREIYHPLFEKYDVDLVLGGHNHNYQRTYPLTYNPNKSSKPVPTNNFGTGYNSKADGIVFATVGTGGVNFYSLDGRDPYMATQFADKFGFLNIEIKNGNPDTKLTGTFYDNKGSEVADEFTIEKRNKNKSNNASYS